MKPIEPIELNSSCESSGVVRCLWQKILVPDLDGVPGAWKDATFDDQIPNLRRVVAQNNEIVIPDPKAIRSMSRASLFLSSFCDELKPILEPYLAQSPFSVGIYCAVENGPIDGPSTAEIIRRSGEVCDVQFAEAYRKLRNPKMYLKQLPNLAPAQMGISLGIQGPMNVYTHSLHACQHALDQAQVDLYTRLVDVALVLSAHAFDDFWVVKRTRLQEERTLCEGAAAQVLVRTDKDPQNLSSNKLKICAKLEYLFDAENYFGISDPLINLIRKGN